MKLISPDSWLYYQKMVLYNITASDGSKSRIRHLISQMTVGSDVDRGTDLSLPSTGPPPQHKQQKSTASSNRNKGTSTPARTEPRTPAHKQTYIN